MKICDETKKELLKFGAKHFVRILVVEQTRWWFQQKRWLSDLDC